MDEVNNSEIEQVAPVETSPIEGIEQAQVEAPQDRNWKELNRAKRELEKKVKMQDELLEKFLRNQAPQPVQHQEPDDLDQIPDDDYVPKGKQKKLVKKEVEPLQRRIDELEAKLQQQAQVNQFETLKRKYSDFDEVVNPDTIAIFEEQEPELAQAIIETQDPYKKWIQTYKYIKASNISEQVPKARRAREIDKKVESNKKTVQSPQAFDKRPMAQAFKLTDAERSKLYEEMMHYASQAGSSY